MSTAVDLTPSGTADAFPLDQPVTLPASARTKCGQVFDPRDHLWAIRKHAGGGNMLRFDWTRLEGFTREAVDLAKRMLADRAPSYAATTRGTTSICSPPWRPGSRDMPRTGAGELQPNRGVSWRHSCATDGGRSLRR